MNLCDIRELKALMQRHGFKTQKQFGQNFLINEEIPRSIAQQSDLEGCGAIEIGPGVGCLTRELGMSAKKVIAIEIDRKLEPVLAETLSDLENTSVVFGDVMKLDLKELISKEFEGMDVRICANLPYYITTPIIMKLLEERLPLKSITVMVQKEVARRLCADETSKDNGAISLAIQYFTKPNYLFDVPREDFLPAPNVDSAVIRLDVLSEPAVNVANEELLFKIIKAAYSQRRKTLLNSLSNMTGLDKAALAEYLVSIGKNADIRAERMSLEDFARLSDIIGKNHSL